MRGSLPRAGAQGLARPAFVGRRTALYAAVMPPAARASGRAPTTIHPSMRSSEAWAAALRRPALGTGAACLPFLLPTTSAHICPQERVLAGPAAGARW